MAKNPPICPNCKTAEFNHVCGRTKAHKLVQDRPQFKPVRPQPKPYRPQSGRTKR